MVPNRSSPLNLPLSHSSTKKPQLTQQTLDLNKEYRGTVHTAIWVYFWLLIFEGALRKWVLPGLSSPLLLVREPVALYILVIAWSRNRFPINGYVISMLVIGFIGTLTAVFLGHGNLVVALFGARILVLHFPLMFVIGEYFTENDVLKMGRILLWLALPMAILMAFQFYSPQSAWVNRGIGGDESGGGFSGAMGFFRPPATFSFITGTSTFFSLVAAFVFYFWIGNKPVNRLILIGATLGLLASIPLSISRTLFYQVAVTVLFTGIAVSRKPKLFSRFLFAAFGIAILLALLSLTGVFQTSTEAFIQRFSSATESEGGVSGTLIDRFLGGMVGAINDSQELPFFGFGLGIGTNAGAQLLTGSRSFIISEGEWGRLIGELGLLLGLGVIVIRLLVVAYFSRLAYMKLSVSNILPWLLLSVGAINILQGQWAQPTNLGFSTLIGGLLLAATREQTAGQHELKRK